MSKFAELFENTTIKGKDGDIDPATLDGKAAVALYFSAHWCSPCKIFTPQLAKKYKHLTENGKDFEVIFVSSDKNQSEYNEYWASMPWPSLGFKSDIIAKLNKTFKINGIPSLIVLDGNAELITANGRAAISTTNYVENFPWVPPSIFEMLGSRFTSKTGDVTFEAAVKGKTIALYFSASWCGPCKAFTPKLIDVYNKLNAEGKDFEVIFCSSDSDVDQFNLYYGDMPWLALPYELREEKKILSSFFNVKGIPSLVVLDADGTVINPVAASAVKVDTTGAEFPWYPKAINDLSITADGLNTHACCILLGEKAEALDMDGAVSALTSIAEGCQAEARNTKSEMDMRFFYTKTEGAAVGQIRNLLKQPVEENKITLAIIDIPDNGGYYIYSESSYDEASIKEFVADYKAGTLTRIQMV